MPARLDVVDEIAQPTTDVPITPDLWRAAMPSTSCEVCTRRTSLHINPLPNSLGRPSRQARPAMRPRNVRRCAQDRRCPSSVARERRVHVPPFGVSGGELSVSGRLGCRGLQDGRLLPVGARRPVLRIVPERVVQGPVQPAMNLGLRLQGLHQAEHGRKGGRGDP
jgi:hypothetical protein